MLKEVKNTIVKYNSTNIYKESLTVSDCHIKLWNILKSLINFKNINI